MKTFVVYLTMFYEMRFNLLLVDVRGRTYLMNCKTAEKEVLSYSEGLQLNLPPTKENSLNLESGYLVTRSKFEIHIFKMQVSRFSASTNLLS